MMEFFKTKKKETTADDRIVRETRELLQEMLQKIDLRFNEISSQIKEVELSVQELEIKLLTKDLRDKQQMGAFHYKLHEKSNEKLNSEMERKRLELALKKPTN